MSDFGKSGRFLATLASGSGGFAFLVRLDGALQHESGRHGLGRRSGDSQMIARNHIFEIEFKKRRSCRPTGSPIIAPILSLCPHQQGITTVRAPQGTFFNSLGYDRTPCRRKKPSIAGSLCHLPAGGGRHPKTSVRPRQCARSTGCGQPLCRHDGPGSRPIQTARQDRRVRRRRGHVLSARHDHWQGFPSANQPHKGADRDPPFPYRAGLAPRRPSCYVCRRSLGVILGVPTDSAATALVASHGRMMMQTRALGANRAPGATAQISLRSGPAITRG